MSEVPIHNWPDNILILSAAGVRLAASQIANEILSNRVKNVTVVTGDWTGPVTDYPKAAQLGNLPAFRADVVHAMNNPNAYPNHGSAEFNEFIVAQSLIAERIDLDTTRVWIFADQAPPYDVVFTFVA